MKYLAGLVAICLFAGCDINVNVGGNSNGIKGSGVSKSESREVESFNSISLEGYGTLKISQGDEESVTITTDDNLLEVIKTNVKDNVLTISPSESISPKSGLKIDVVTKDIVAVNSDGAATIEVADIVGDSIKFDLSGAATVSGTGEYTDLTVSIAGAGTAKLSEFKSENTKVTISGAGSATVYAKSSVDAEINGTGTIRVHGNPDDVKKTVNGFGTITVVE